MLSLVKIFDDSILAVVWVVRVPFAEMLTKFVILYRNVFFINVHACDILRMLLLIDFILIFVG